MQLLALIVNIKMSPLLLLPVVTVAKEVEEEKYIDKGGVVNQVEQWVVVECTSEWGWCIDF